MAENLNMTDLSMELRVPYQNLYREIRKGRILDDCKRDREIYIIPSDKMRRLRRAANISRIYRVGFAKAYELAADGFVPPAEKVERIGAA